MPRLMASFRNGGMPGYRPRVAVAKAHLRVEGAGVWCLVCGTGLILALAAVVFCALGACRGGTEWVWDVSVCVVGVMDFILMLSP
jgi:hypothetical protein